MVTARQRTESLQEAPVTVTALSADAMDRLQLTNLEQVAQQIPNLRINVGGSGAGSSVFLRGIGTGPDSAGFSSAVGLLIDDVHFERGRWVQQAYFDLEQVEVLKGPQSLYFGKNNAAGLVILRSRDPGDELEGNFRVGYEGEAEEVTLEGGVSVPVSDELAFRVAARYSKELDGWINNRAQPQTGVDPLGFDLPGAAGNRDLPNRRDFNARFTGVWTPTDRLSANLKGTLGSHRSKRTDQLARCFGPGGSPQAIYGVESPNAECRKNFTTYVSQFPYELFAPEPGIVGNGSTGHEWDGYTASLRLDYDFDRFTLTSVTGYQEYDVKQVQNATNDEAAQVPAMERTEYDNLSQELRIQTRLDSPINFLAGILYTDSDLEFRSKARIAPLPADSRNGRLWSWDKTSFEDGESWSIYGEATWDITDTVELSGGARYTEERKRFSFVAPFVHEILLGAGALSDAPLSGRFKDSDTSPQVSLAWRPSETLTLFSAYREGFKSGGFDASFLLTPGAGIEELEFQSEQSSGFEFGLRSQWLDRTLQINVTAYFYEYDDLQVTSLDTETVSFRIQNAAKATTDGMEVDVSWATPVDGLDLRAFVNYNIAEYDEFDSACYAGQSVEAGCDGNFDPATGRFTTQDLSGVRLPVAPRWTGTAGFTYEIPNLGDTGWSASLSGDARYMTKYNTTIRNLPDTFDGDFVVFDAGIRLFSPDDRWELALIGRNLSNRAVVDFGSERALTGSGQGLPAGSPELQRADYEVRVQRGRQLWLRAGYRF